MSLYSFIAILPSVQFNLLTFIYPHTVGLQAMYLLYLALALKIYDVSLHVFHLLMLTVTKLYTLNKESQRGMLPVSRAV